jgi:SnoaL-like domain
VTRSDIFAQAVMVQNDYASAIDRRDWSALGDCFSPDAMIKYGRPSRWGSLEEFLIWAPPFHAELGATLHQTTTHRLGQCSDGSASASCYLHAVLMDADGLGALEIFGHYADELVDIDGRWVIRRREFHPVWRRRTAGTDPVTA